MPKKHFVFFIKEAFVNKVKLTEIIGTQMQTTEGRWTVPVPHPSEASRWHQIKENQALIQKAIGLIRGHRERMFGEQGN